MKPGSLLVLLSLPLTLALSGCYADQRQQLATCETAAAHHKDGKLFDSITSCMAGAGYRFIGLDEGVVCDARAVVLGRPSYDGTDAMCFEPANWFQRRLYRIEVPERKVPPA